MGHEATIPWLEPDRIVMLPFSRPIFSQIVRRFLIHSSVVRAIDRMMSSMFSSMFYDWVHEGSTTSSIGMFFGHSIQNMSYNIDELVYNCRSAVTWSGGMAMSVTYLPATMTTYAMVYGCDLSRGDNDGGDVSTADIIIEKLSNLDCEVFHPILLPAIYADLERDRHAELVEKTINNPSQRVYDIARRQGCHSDASSSEDSSRRGDESFMVWVKISGLKNSLENWRRQLLKMVDHVDDLERRNYGMEREGHDIAENEKRLRALRESGARIKQRLLDLIDEYDEYIRNCGYTMEGMNIATQLVSSNSSTNKTGLELTDLGTKQHREDRCKDQPTNLESQPRRCEDGPPRWESDEVHCHARNGLSASDFCLCTLHSQLTS